METILLNYGALGLWTGYMIWKEKNHYKEMKESLDNNTKVMHEIQVVLASKK